MTTVADLRRQVAELGRRSRRPPPTQPKRLTTAENRLAFDQLLAKIDYLAATNAPAPKLTPAEAVREREILAELDAFVATMDARDAEGTR